MSSKSSRGPMKVKQAAAPREMEAIQRNGAELYNRAGQIQYHIDVLQKDLDQVNTQLLSINQEAACRQQLDAEALKKQQAAEEVANVP